MSVTPSGAKSKSAANAFRAPPRERLYPRLILHRLGKASFGMTPDCVVSAASAPTPTRSRSRSHAKATHSRCCCCCCCCCTCPTARLPTLTPSGTRTHTHTCSPSRAPLACALCCLHIHRFSSAARRAASRALLLRTALMAPTMHQKSFGSGFVGKIPALRAPGDMVACSAYTMVCLQPRARAAAHRPNVSTHLDVPHNRRNVPTFAFCGGKLQIFGRCARQGKGVAPAAQEGLPLTARARACAQHLLLGRGALCWSGPRGGVSKHPAP